MATGACSLSGKRAMAESRLVAASRVKGFDLDPIGTFDGAAVSLSSKSK